MGYASVLACCMWYSHGAGNMGEPQSLGITLNMTKTTRRTAIKALGAISTLGASLAIPSLVLGKGTRLKAAIKLGVIADLHGGLAVDADARLDAFLLAMKSQACDALVQMGDFAYPNEKHQPFADKFNAAHAQTLHVIGNHEFDHGLKREDCIKAWGIPASYYAHDIGNLRVLVLDGNEVGSPSRTTGYPSYVGKTQQQWLRKQLSESANPVLILSHQPLAGTSAIDNAADIQKLLGEFKSKIVLCLNGHSHVDSLLQIDGIPYLHLNSASYYWVGGKTRMAYYSDPLFTTITINPDTATIDVAASTSTWKGKSPKQIGYFEKENAPPEAIVTPQIRAHHVSRSELKCMTWNIWGRLNQDARYTVDAKTARQRTIDIIRDSGADVVALIETYGSAAEIAEALNFHYHTPAADANLCILSRYPLSVVELLKELNPFSFIAATVTLPGGQLVRVYDVWLTSGGRHIVEIKDKALSDEDFARGDDNRFDHVQQLLRHPTFRKDVEASGSVPLIIAGDFNCVSHLDHTQATRESGLNHSRVLTIKVSQAMAQAGFADSYRVAHPTVAAETLGHTWTAVGKDYMFESGKGFVPTDDHPRPEYQDPYARIDYIYARGGIAVLDSKVIARNPKYSDRMFPEFPSDHAAVVTTFRVEPSR